MLHPGAPEPPNTVDRLLHAMIARFTQGISPTSLALAWCDWTMHLTLSPGKWHELAEKR
ncbi:poly-beta-hydroxybutyrate polymerase N-terminal domain-containing protein [Massilia sp. B-10]|nr:poly-beta-hydroxybutyrate polymerase N-terminal domain-containing protein [Massilia sp. B-10]